MNLNTRALYTPISFSLFLSLTACGTQYAYHQTETEVQNFKNLSLQTFIRDRIIDSERVAFSILPVQNPVTKVLTTVNRGKSTHEELEYKKYREENLIYRGFFNSLYHALTKPKKDLELFCKVNGGRLQTISINKTNLAQNFPDNSLQNMPEAYKKMIRMNNYQINNYEANSSMSKAISEESFGEFSCRKNNSDIWSVNIKPLLLLGQKNVVTDDPIYEIYIGVTPTASAR